MILESHANFKATSRVAFFLRFPRFAFELIKQNKKEEGLHVSSARRKLLILKLLMMLLCEIRTCVFFRMSYLMSVDNWKMQSADILQREISLKISYTTQSNMIFFMMQLRTSEAKRSEFKTIFVKDSNGIIWNLSSLRCNSQDRKITRSEICRDIRNYT